MKSPFPGMDPYIEACGLWGDFHSHLIEKIGEKRADLAPEHYLVRTGERSYVVLVDEEHRETFVEIYEATAGQRLMTSIEVLSPSNKRPGTEGWELYQRKRQALLLGKKTIPLPAQYRLQQAVDPAASCRRNSLAQATNAGEARGDFIASRGHIPGRGQRTCLMISMNGSAFALKVAAGKKRGFADGSH